MPKKTRGELIQRAMDAVTKSCVWDAGVKSTLVDPIDIACARRDILVSLQLLWDGATHQQRMRDRKVKKCQ